MTVPTANRPDLPCLHLLALAVALASPAAASAADDAPVCPVGVLKCPKPKHLDDFSLCKRNDLLDFYRPGLPEGTDRSQSQTDISARKISSTDSSHYRLEGEVELQRADELVRADTITYDSTTTAYDAQGNVRVQQTGMLMSADHARGTNVPRTSYLDNIRYQMLDKRGNGTAATANMTDADHGTLTDGTYSTCDPSDRRWYLRGDKLEMDKVENVGRAHDVTLYYADVPFFWFPYLKFPLSSERESGFLTPHVGYGNRRGLVIGIPYYLNLAPNYDATIEPRWSSNRGGMLEGQFRYLDASDKAQIDFNYVPHDGEVDDERAQYALAPPQFQGPPSPLDLPERRYAFRVQEASTFSDNWQTVVDINRVSDKQYFQDYGNSLTSSANSLLASNAYLNGRGEWWNASIGGDSIQLTQPYLSDAFKPYERLPRATFQGEHAVLGGLAFGANAEYVNFRRGPFDILSSGPGTPQEFDSIEGQRVDLYPYIAFPLEAAGYFLRPELGVRYTTYDLHDLQGFAATHPNVQPFTDKSPSRSVPIFNLDAGLIFERPLTLFGSELTQTLEPRLYYLRVPYRDQTDLPVFDTVLPTFDFPSLFRSNAFVGADRQSNANNLTLAMTSRLIDTASGDEFLSASLGQIRYFDTQRVQLPGRPEVDYSGSDIVAEVDVRPNDRWEFKWDQQYNPNSRIIDPTTQMLVDNLHHTDLSAVSVEHRFGAEGAWNFSYRFRRGLLEQVDTSALYPFNERWSLVGRYYYSLLDKRLLEAFAGAQYDSCCVALRVLVRRYITSVGQVHPNTGLYFELEFKGLGNTGTRTENFLRKAILGYE
jgi:LPS-assembly protein